MPFAEYAVQREVRTMNSVLAEKSEIGIWYKKVEFELDSFIFITPKPLPEEEWTKLCEKYGEHQTRVLVGDALLIDLRGKEPTFESIPADFNGDQVVNVIDFSLHKANFGTSGAPPIGPGGP